MQNASEVIVRFAKPDDAAALVRLYDMLLHTHEDTAVMRDSVARICTDPNNCILVAETDGAVAGTIQVTICSAVAYGGRPNAFLEFFIVDPAYRRMGVGTKLCEAAEQVCMQYDVTCIEVVSGAERTQAHALYRKMGFDPTVKGFRKDFV